jgi:LemA protein
MSKAIIGGVVVVVIVLFVSLFGSYNTLVGQEQSVQAKWAQVEGQYQRRMDLIPNLVATVKGAANFEQSTLTGVIDARAKATQVTVDPTKLDADSLAKYQAAQGELSQALGKLLVLTENYPTLRATENFKDLQSQIEGTENRIAVARKDFGDAVQVYNTSIKRFPGNMVARIFGFNEKAYFKADVGASSAPAVVF